ncbi:unnamed protein product [Coffea canephora]|uniref:Uncharacterized protein n=1 Tax=Coffea canephora TaxID=49390 RepID=A0A068TL45_COFCA|nr:unnamed protein product [Coffea canephora]
MRGVSHLLFLLVSIFFVVSFCRADDKTVQVVGAGECADCKDFKIKTSQAFSGLRVTVDCKLKNGEVTRRVQGIRSQRNSERWETR